MGATRADTIRTYADTRVPAARMCSKAKVKASAFRGQGQLCDRGPSRDQYSIQCLCLANTLTQTDIVGMEVIAKLHFHSRNTKNIRCINTVSTVTALQVAVALKKS